MKSDSSLRTDYWFGLAVDVVTAMIFTICSLVALYFVLVLIAALNQGYGRSEMDWNSDGATSISELFVSSDIGKRQTIIDDHVCDVYFAYKDARTVKQICK